VIPFGPFRPDVGGPNTGVAANIVNALPQAAGKGIGYGPFPALVTPTGAGALSGAPRGAITLRTSLGDSETYFATDSTIEKLAADYTWTTIATGLAVEAGFDQSLVHFGSYLLNTNAVDGFKAYNIETPGTNDDVSGAPAARFIFICNNVVFALACDGNNRQMKSSGLGDHTTWTSSGANSKTFEDGGELVAGCDLKNGYAVVFQEAAMRLIQFGNAPQGALYSIAKASDGRGSVGARSVVAIDGVVYFLDSDGFWSFDLSRGNVPIGAEKVNAWFLSKVDNSRLADVQGAVDPKRKIVVWRYPVIGEDAVFANAIGYDWHLGEWFRLSVSTSYLTSLETPGYTLDDMDTFGDLDELSIPLDDRFWQGSLPFFAALDADYKVASFSGDPMAATLETAPVNSPVTGLVGRATPIDDCADGTLQLGVADDPSTALTWKTGAARGARGGRVPLRGRGLNIAFRRNIPAGSTWTYANGVDHVESASGGPS
jgi:hypothetical protein